MICDINFPGYEFQVSLGQPLNIDILTRLALVREKMPIIDRYYYKIKQGNITNKREMEEHYMAMMQKYQMLVWYLVFTYQDRIYDTLIDPTLLPNSVEYYQEYFNIPNIADCFKCMHMPIDEALKAFGLHDSSGDIDYKNVALDVVIRTPNPLN